GAQSAREQQQLDPAAAGRAGHDAAASSPSGVSAVVGQPSPSSRGSSHVSCRGGALAGAGSGSFSSSAGVSSGSGSGSGGRRLRRAVRREGVDAAGASMLAGRSSLSSSAAYGIAYSASAA